MVSGIDYHFIPKIKVSTEKGIFKTAIWFTKKSIFIVPLDKAKVLYATSDATVILRLVEEIKREISKLDDTAFHSLFYEKLEKKWIFEISRLEIFSIQIGVWIFGGVRVKKKGDQLLSINVQPKALREKLKLFYGL